jgi:Circularly permutated YpsA SLOG family
MSLKKIISGGQTGADIAGIDAAIVNGMPYGGWLPKGRKTEFGPLDSRYVNMTEMSVDDYKEMTEQNVKEADGTVIFTHGKYTGVSALTSNFAEKHNKPALHLDLDVISELAAIESLIEWIYKHKIEILNVAGSRESKDEHIYDDVHSIIKSIINTLKTAEVMDTSQTPPVSEPSLPEPVIATPQVIDKEVATEKVEKKESDTPSTSGLASLMERWPKTGQKNLLYIALGILVLTIALMIIPGGFKNSSPDNTPAKSIPLSAGRDSKKSELPSDITSPSGRTPEAQSPSDSLTATNPTEKAGIRTSPPDSKTPVDAQAMSPENNPDIKTDTASKVVDQSDKKENEPLQSSSDTSGGTEKIAKSQVLPKKKPSTNRNRCGSLYKKIALGEVLKKSEAKFLAKNCK